MELTITPFSRSLREPLSTADGTITERQGFRIRLSDGETIGLGEATPLAGWTEDYDTCKETLIAARGKIKTAPETLFEDVSPPAARHGLHLAVADYRARQAGVSLAASIGTGTLAPVAINATVGAHTTATTVAAVKDALAAGYETIKLKIGADQWAADRKRISAVLDELPASVRLRLDVNGQWSEQTAQQACEWLSTIDQIEYVEQPLPADRLEAHQHLRDHGVAVAIDEGLQHFTPEAILKAQAADVLICKPMVLGGIDRTQTAIEQAKATGHTATITTTIDGTIAQTGALHLAAACQPLPACGLGTDSLLEEDGLMLPFKQSGGTITVGGDPGIGLDGS